MFETLIIQPIFNVLLILYTAIGDFGVAIIVFTVLVRMLMWPLLRKQLHQGRAIRKIQPQIKEIRKKNKGGDKQKESKELMELYKKNGIRPFGSFGLLFIQIPVFLGLFSALRSIIENPERIVRFPYDFLADNSTVQGMFTSIAEKTNEAINGLSNIELKESLLSQFGGSVSGDELRALSQSELHNLFTNTLVTDTASGTQSLVQGPFFEQHLFGIIDLSGRAFGDGQIYIPVLIIAVLAGIFQFFQTKQLIPQDDNAKSVRELMKDAAKGGKEPDQSEISAAMNKRLGLFFAPLITIISATSPSGLALYFASSGLVGLLQQRRVLKGDVDEMELIADAVEDEGKNSKKTKATTKKSSSKKKKAGKKKGR